MDLELSCILAILIGCGVGMLRTGLSTMLLSLMHLQDTFLCFAVQQLIYITGGNILAIKTLGDVTLIRDLLYAFSNYL